MGLSLQKGGNLSLSKAAPGMTAAMVGLGWDERQTSGADFDLDASAILLGADGKVRSDADFIFYNQLESADRSVIHQGDNRTGAGEGDDEQILINLTQIPAAIQRIVVAVTIDKAAERQQNFGQVSNAFIRIVDASSNSEVVRYDLTEDYSTETALIFGELYRHGNEWKFRAVGQGYQGGLGPLARSFGINIG